MALDPSAREANIWDSLRKFFVDNIETGEGIFVTFDTFLDIPDFQNKTYLRWLSVNLGPLDMGTMSEVIIDLYCCSREDPEGFRLAQTRDKVMGYLTDTAQTDGMKRIPFYRSYSNRSWDLLGSILIQEATEPERGVTKDGTKYRKITCRLRLASKV